MTYRPGFRSAVSTILLLAVSAGCAPGASIAQEVPAGASTTSDAGAGVYLPEGFPETFRFPTGSVLLSASGGMPPEYASRSYLVEVKAEVTKAEAAEFFRTMLEKDRFEIVSEEEGNATVIRFDTYGLDEGSVMIVDGYDDGTSIFTVSMIMDPELE
jgi:hypothetical protein